MSRQNRRRTRAACPRAPSPARGAGVNFTPGVSDSCSTVLALEPGATCAATLRTLDLLANASVNWSIVGGEGGFWRASATDLTADAVLPGLSGSPRAMAETTDRVVALGTSTGGTQALEALVALAYKNAKNSFTLPGLGKLVLVNRKARMGRNPATGETIKIAAKRVVKFRVAKAAKDAILGAK